MSNGDLKIGPEDQRTVVLKKEIVPFDQDGPLEEPLFTNHCLVAYHGGIVYIDVGVLPLDEVVAGEQPGEVRFLVLNRLVMSVVAAKNLKEQLEELLTRVGGS